MLIPHPARVQRRTRIPPIYRKGLYPFRWQDDESGELPTAVHQLFDATLGEATEPTPAQMSLIIDWLIHFIYAPCWSQTAQMSLDEGCVAPANKLIGLRLDLVEERVTTVAELRAWVARALELGIDPF